MISVFMKYNLRRDSNAKNCLWSIFWISAEYYYRVHLFLNRSYTSIPAPTKKSFLGPFKFVTTITKFEWVVKKNIW